MKFKNEASKNNNLHPSPHLSLPHALWLLHLGSFHSYGSVRLYGDGVSQAEERRVDGYVRGVGFVVSALRESGARQSSVECCGCRSGSTTRRVVCEGTKGLR